MTNTKHYLVSLLIILLIAAADRYIFIELQPAPPDMVWVDGDEFAANSKDDFTDLDADQVFEIAGFWIDKSVVSKSSYQAFIAATGYVGAAPVTFDDPNAPTLPAPGDQHLFGLYDPAAPDAAPHALQYISHADAMAFCEWKGMELSSEEQFEFVNENSPVEGLTSGTIAHTSHPWSTENGFRCMKLPEWAHQQGYN